jgi:hypothetical protein
MKLITLTALTTLTTLTTLGFAAAYPAGTNVPEVTLTLAEATTTTALFVKPSNTADVYPDMEWFDYVNSYEENADDEAEVTSTLHATRATGATAVPETTLTLNRRAVETTMTLTADNAVETTMTLGAAPEPTAVVVETWTLREEAAPTTVVTMTVR